MEIKNILPKFKLFLKGKAGVVLIYVFLALFFTFPLILNITGSMATGKNAVDNEYTINSDSIYFTWNFWLFKHNLIDLKTSPFSHSDIIFYPNGFDINAAGNDNLFNSILSVPLQLVFKNLILTYNIIVLFNFVFAAFAAYLLINYLISDKKISLLGGIIFGFSPYMLARSLGHFSLITTGAIPLFILMFLKMLKEPGAKNAFLAAIAFVLTALGAWQYGLFSLIFIFCSLLYFAACRKEKILSKKFLISFLLFTALAIISLAPIAFPMAQGYFSGNMIPHPFSDTILYSASILSYFTPPPLSTFFGNLVNPELFKSFSVYMAESAAYLGFLEIAIIFYYFANRKKISGKSRYWLFLLAIFFILSLGPYLKLSLPNLVFDKIPLPYYFIFKYIPFFNFAREASRLSIFVMLFTAIIFAFALKYILSKNNFNARAQKMILAVFAAIVIAERMTLPYPIEKIKIPAFYKNISQDKGDYAILDLPSDFWLTFSLYNLYQTTHGKKITSGDIQPNAFTPKVYSFIENNDFLSEGTCLTEANTNKKFKDYSEKDKNALINEFRNARIKYVIVHKDIINYIDAAIRPSGKIWYDCAALKTNIQEFFGNSSPVYEDELIKVYQL